MPVYNCQKFLKQAIESILTQTYTDFELIIMDNCSTDGSYEIEQEYAKKDPRVRVFRNEENVGITNNRNRGLDHVRGRYVANMDSDDVSQPQRLAAQVEFMDAHPEVGIVGAQLNIIDENGTILKPRPYPLQDAQIRKLIFTTGPFAQPVTMIRKEVYDKIGKYNKQYEPSDDLDFAVRAGQFFKFANLDKTLLHYRISTFSTTTRKMKLMRTVAVKAKLDAILKHGYRPSIGGAARLLAQGTLAVLPSAIGDRVKPRN